MRDGDPGLISDALRCGAEPREECFPGYAFCPRVNALCSAAAIDSDRSQVLQVPLILQSGIDVNHVDVNHWRAVDFATFGPLHEYLRGLGAIDGTGSNVGEAGDFIRNQIMRRHLGRCQDASRPLTSDEWPGRMPDSLIASLRRIGCVGAEGMAGLVGSAAPPLVCLKWPHFLFCDALALGDVERVRNLVSRVDPSYVGDFRGFIANGAMVSGTGIATLATMVDSAVGSPTLLGIIQGAGFDLSVADAEGRTCLAFATTSSVQRFLIDAGLDPWRPGDAGVLPFDHLYPDVRAQVEAVRLSSMVGTTPRVAAQRARL